MTFANDKKFWYLWLGLILVMLAIVLCSVFIGCGISAKSKPVQKLQKDITDIQKTVNNTADNVKGNANTLTEVNDSSKHTETTMETLQMQLTQQIQQGQGVTARQIEKLETKIINTTNSTVLMIVIIAMLVFLIAFLITVLALIIKRLFSLRYQVKNAIKSNDNTLTEEQFNGFKK